MTSIELALKNNKLAKLLEITIIFSTAPIIIIIGYPLLEDNPIFLQSIAWVANIFMLLLIWLGLRLRKQNWQHLGLSIKNINLRNILISFVVFIIAMIGFVLGSVIMANITGIPESADMSGYNYLQGNLPMLIVALVAVFIASSFGEEVIYRGFLITRISEFKLNDKNLIKFAVVISSIIFGFIHYAWGPMGIVQTSFMGFALAISYIKLKRNLWILIFAHAYMDSILMIQMYLGK